MQVHITSKAASLVSKIANSYLQAAFRMEESWFYQIALIALLKTLLLLITPLAIQVESFTQKTLTLNLPILIILRIKLLQEESLDIQITNLTLSLIETIQETNLKIILLYYMVPKQDLTLNNYKSLQVILTRRMKQFL